MKILIWAVSAILGVLLAALAVVYFSPDYNLYTVRSESMVPDIRMGDMVLTGPPGGPFSGGLVAGTVITFTRGKETVTHRILSAENDVIVTKGDANNGPDQNTVTAADVQGVVFFKIPLIGFVTGFIRTKLGWFLTILIPTAVLIGFLIKDIISEAFGKDKKLI
jgi:signal peptidase I